MFNRPNVQNDLFNFENITIDQAKNKMVKILNMNETDNTKTDTYRSVVRNILQNIQKDITHTEKTTTVPDPITTIGEDVNYILDIDSDNETMGNNINKFSESVKKNITKLFINKFVTMRNRRLADGTLDRGVMVNELKAIEMIAEHEMENSPIIKNLFKNIAGEAGDMTLTISTYDSERDTFLETKSRMESLKEMYCNGYGATPESVDKLIEITINSVKMKFDNGELEQKELAKYAIEVFKENLNVLKRRKGFKRGDVVYESTFLQELADRDAMEEEECQEYAKKNSSTAEINKIANNMNNLWHRDLSEDIIDHRKGTSGLLKGKKSVVDKIEISDKVKRKNTASSFINRNLKETIDEAEVVPKIDSVAEIHKSAEANRHKSIEETERDLASQSDDNREKSINSSLDRLKKRVKKQDVKKEVEEVVEENKEERTELDTVIANRNEIVDLIQDTPELKNLIKSKEELFGDSDNPEDIKRFINERSERVEKALNETLDVKTTILEDDLVDMSTDTFNYINCNIFFVTNMTFHQAYKAFGAKELSEMLTARGYKDKYYSEDHITAFKDLFDEKTPNFSDINKYVTPEVRDIKQMFKDKFGALGISMDDMLHNMKADALNKPEDKIEVTVDKEAIEENYNKDIEEKVISEEINKTIKEKELDRKNKTIIAQENDIVELKDEDIEKLPEDILYGDTPLNIEPTKSYKEIEERMETEELVRLKEENEKLKELIKEISFDKDTSILRSSKYKDKYSKLEAYRASGYEGRRFFLELSNYPVIVKKAKSKLKVNSMISLLKDVRESREYLSAYMKRAVVKMVYENLEFPDFPVRPTYEEFEKCVCGKDLNLLVLMMIIVNTPVNENGEILCDINTLECTNPECLRELYLEKPLKVDLIEVFKEYYNVEKIVRLENDWQKKNYETLSDAYLDGEYGEIHSYFDVDDDGVVTSVYYSRTNMYKEFMVESSANEILYEMIKEDALTEGMGLNPELIKSNRTYTYKTFFKNYDSHAKFSELTSFMIKDSSNVDEAKARLEADAYEHENVSQKADDIILVDTADMIIIISEIMTDAAKKIDYSLRLAKFIDFMEVRLFSPEELRRYKSEGDNYNMDELNLCSEQLLKSDAISTYDAYRFFVDQPEKFTNMLIDLVEKTSKDILQFKDVLQFSQEDVVGRLEKRLIPIEEYLNKLEENGTFDNDTDGAVRKFHINEYKNMEKDIESGLCVCGHDTYVVNYYSLLFFLMRKN